MEKKSNKKKIVFTSLGILATGILAYFGYQRYKLHQQEKQIKEENNGSSFTQLPQSASSKIASSSNLKLISSGGSPAGFPLRKGSKGENVKTLQQVLIDKYGKTILPKAGADGIFGQEMIAALKKLGLPEDINESTFNVLVKGNSIDPIKTAQTFDKAVRDKNFNQVLFTLRAMKTSSDYQAVSTAFLPLRSAGVRKTLVNGLLDAFTDPKQKQQISLEFTRMGLNYDGNKWSR